MNDYKVITRTYKLCIAGTMDCDKCLSLSQHNLYSIVPTMLTCLVSRFIKHELQYLYNTKRSKYFSLSVQQN